MATPAEMVIQIDDAISALVTGGAIRTISDGGQALTYENLDDLRNLRKYYAGLATSAELATGDKRPIRMFGVGYAKPQQTGEYE